MRQRSEKMNQASQIFVTQEKKLASRMTVGNDEQVCGCIYAIINVYMYTYLVVGRTARSEVTSASSTSDMDLMQSLHARRNFTVNTFLS